jgi:hypothetical protein
MELLGLAQSDKAVSLSPRPVSQPKVLPEFARHLDFTKLTLCGSTSSD